MTGFPAAKHLVSSTPHFTPWPDPVNRSVRLGERREFLSSPGISIFLFPLQLLYPVYIIHHCPFAGSNPSEAGQPLHLRIIHLTFLLRALIVYQDVHPLSVQYWADDSAFLWLFDGWETDQLLHIDFPRRSITPPIGHFSNVLSWWYLPLRMV